MVKILFIDDEIENCQIIERYFRYKGFDFISETDPNNSVFVYRNHKPQIVMIDINLGDGMDGIDVLSRIRKEESAREAKIIMLSGLVRAEFYKNEAMNRGADDFVIKPIDPNELFIKVQSYVQ